MTSRDTHHDHLWVVTARCSACGSCEQACRKRHGIARLARPRHGQPIVFPEVCRQCAFPACVDSCISGGLARDASSGQLIFNNERCMACWSCILECPHGAVRRDLRDRPLSARCHRCREYKNLACVSACPTGAIRFGDDDALRADLVEAEKLGRPLAATVICLALPFVGLVVGFVGQGWVCDHGHILGIAAAALMAAALLLWVMSRILATLTGRRFWTTGHVAAGVLGAALAMAHTRGRFGINAQSAAAMLVLLLVVTAVTYRYLQPLILVWEAMFFRRAAMDSPVDDTRTPAARSKPLNVEVMAAGARQARAWYRLLHGTANLLAASKWIHMVAAILTAGLVLAHAIIMTWIGAD